ncbi:hypothetical protein BJ165DRAFT_1483077 [Panaeolus papilionaceus]|nr:hypothetical protein BJ165DRAFT_1483077 [Panaeolus papilionaceus]
MAHPDPPQDRLSHAHILQPLEPNKCYLPNPQALRSHFHHRVSNCPIPTIIAFVFGNIDIDVGFVRA